VADGANFRRSKIGNQERYVGLAVLGSNGARNANFYMRRAKSGDRESLGLDFPSKWIYRDGKTMWAVFSGGKLTRATMCWIRLISSGSL
jgi:hypothetical protein